MLAKASGSDSDEEPHCSSALSVRTHVRWEPWLPNECQGSAVSAWVTRPAAMTLDINAGLFTDDVDPS